jgi:predicted secreted protein
MDLNSTKLYGKFMMALSEFFAEEAAAFNSGNVFNPVSYERRRHIEAEMSKSKSEADLEINSDHAKMKIKMEKS